MPTCILCLVVLEQMLITANTVVHEQTVKIARLLLPPMLILMFLITVKTGSQVFKNVLL